MKVKSLCVAALIALASFAAGGAALAASEPREPVVAYGTFDTNGALVTPSQDPARQFETANLTTAPVTDGRVDLSPILQGVLSLLGTALLGATALITAVLNKYLNRKADATRAAMITAFTERAVQAAANYVKGAGLDADGKPREVSFPVASEWVERALEQSVQLFGGMLAGIGGEDAQRRRIWAQMRLPASEGVPQMAPVDLRPTTLKTKPPAPPAAIEPVAAQS